MDETLLMVIAGIVFIIGPFVLIYALDKRRKKQGALFTGKTTRGKQTLAIVLGILFGGIFLYQYFLAHEIAYLFPILAIGLLDYGFGGKLFINKLFNQKKENQTPSENQPDSPQAVIGSSEPDQTRLVSQRSSRFMLKIAVILLISGIFLAGAYWAASNPDNPLAIAFVIGTIIFLVLAKVLDFIGLFKKLFK